MRTFLDFNSIYNSITTEYRGILTQLQKELSDVRDGSAYLLKEGGKIDGDLEIGGKIIRKAKSR